MSRNLSAAEVKAEHVRQLGTDFGETYHALWQELGWLQAVWSEYCELFGTSEQRVALLNESASFFFQVVQRSVWHEVLLRLCRMTDPPQSVGKDNLTVMRLASICPNQAMAPRIEELAERAKLATGFARDWRNRKLAHADLALAIGGAATPLLGASRKQVADAITAIHGVLNTIGREFLGGEMPNTPPIMGPNGGEELLYLLRDGLEAREARRKRIREGGYSTEDIRRPRPL